MVILFSRDLMLASQVGGPAAQLGVDVATVGSLEQLSQRAEQGGVTGVILDLGIGDVSPAEVMAAFSDGASRPRMIAFGPHVRKELFAAAEEAGFDDVLPRGRFVGEVTGILAELDVRPGC